MTQPSAPVPIEALLSQSDWVRRLAYSLTRDPAEADDLVQETWLAVAQHPPAHASNLKSWLRTVMKNLRRKRHRAESRRTAREQAAAGSELTDDIAELSARASMLSKVAGHVQTLDEAHRTVVLLRYFDDLPPRKIAERLGVPVNTVNSRLQRAHGRLREVLRDEFGDGWAAALLPLLRWPPAGGNPPDAPDASQARRFARASAAAAAAVALGVAVLLGTDDGLSGRPPSRERTRDAVASAHSSSAAPTGRRRAGDKDASDGADVPPADAGGESAAGDAATPAGGPDTVRATGTIAAPGAPAVKVTLRLTPLASTQKDIVGTVRTLEVATGTIDVRLPLTDEKGRRIGEWIVDAEAPGCLSKQVRVRMPLPVEGRDATIPEIALTPAPIATGIVTWNARPGQSARVATYRILRSQATAVFDVAKISPGAEFRLRLPPDERALVVATADECLPVVREVDPTAPGQIRASGEFALSPGLSIRGRVHAEGVPLGPSRSVTVFTEKRHHVCINVEDGALSWDGTTAERYSTVIEPGPDGSFAAGGYGRDPFTLTYYGAGRVAGDIVDPLLGRVHEVPADDADLLFRGTPIDLLVTSGGAPVAEARVTLLHPNPKVRRCGDLTGATGTATLLGKPGSTYAWHVELEGYLPADGTVTVPDSGSVPQTRIDLVARPKEPPATWTVRVRSPQGVVPAITGFGFFAVSQKGGFTTIPHFVRDVTPTDGVFRIADIPPGRWRIEIRPGCAWYDPSAFETAPPLTRELGPGESAQDETTALPAGRAVIDVTGLGTVQLVHCPIRVLNDAHETQRVSLSYRAVTGAGSASSLVHDGSADLYPALPPGRYTLEADADTVRGLAPFSVPFEIAAGRVTHVPVIVTRR